MTYPKALTWNRRVGRWLCVAVFALPIGAVAVPAYAGGSHFSFSFAVPLAPYGYAVGSYGYPGYYGSYAYPGYAYAPYPVYVAPAPVYAPGHWGWRGYCGPRPWYPRYRY